MDFSQHITYELASVTLAAGTSNVDNCGANGLPMTASSITMHGNYMAFVAGVQHKHLVQYVSATRLKHENVRVVFEHYTNALPEDVEKILTQVLLALHQLHYDIGCIHGGITPDCLVYDRNNDLVKLSHWAFNAISEFGNLLDADSLLPHDCRFLPLEQIVGLKSCRKSDVWSLALSILALTKVAIPDNPFELVSCKSSQDVLNKLNVDCDNFSPKLKQFLIASLHPHPKNRSNIKELMSLMGMTIPTIEVDNLNKFIRFNNLGQTSDANVKNNILTISQVYHLYCVAFPLVDDDDATRKPPILSLPNLFHRGKETEKSNEKIRKFTFLPRKVKLLQIDKLKERLQQIAPKVFYPLILTPTNSSCETSIQHTALPLNIREGDFNYQCERILLFKRLIDGWPFVKSNLVQAAKVDIPPFYRAQVWSALLNIKWSDLLLYDKIDKISSTLTDRQISVDIPRCHQYNDLLASPQGHIKLTRVLKAWLNHNEQNGCVYWQGLDSLASPFVILNFNNEAQAFACFNAFINKYLRGFFVKDNSEVIQEYLAIFNQLMAFHDPQLFNHLQDLGLLPDLYAIPWFLTMFTHVLPLHKTMHVWDTLLLGDESFALFIGLAILAQLRDNLLEFTFNDCVLIFSDLPEINIDACVKHSIKLFCATPKSASQRGTKSLETLKNEIVPRIDVSDLILLIKNEKSKLKILDARTEDEITRFGTIQGSLKSDEFDSSSISGHLLIIVNDIDKATQMTMESIPRVCLLQLTGYVPNELLG